MKKTLIFGLSSLSLVFMLSNVAFANSTTDYNFRLPDIGSRVTSNVTKPSKKNIGYNVAEYIGWAGSGIHCWIEDINGTDLTTTSSYSSLGTINMYYFKEAAIHYYGHTVNMRLKTDNSTWNQCDVKGIFIACDN